MPFWAAVRVRPQMEMTIADRLVILLGAVVYVPRAKVPLPRSRRTVTQPLYRTYFFADIETGPTWQAIARTPGAVKVLIFGDQPSRCPDSEIAKLKAAEVDGLVQLAGSKPVLERRFAVGEKVKIGAGALEGRNGVYAGVARPRKSRVTVFLLSRMMTVEVPTSALVSLAG